MTALIKENPFVGARSYDEKDKDIFFGREKEIIDLFQLVQVNAFSLLYGRSGLGKSSLLKAGMFPLLREYGFFPVYLRPNYSDKEGDFVIEVQKSIFNSAKERGFNVEVEAINSKETLWEFFHRSPIKDVITGKRLIPVLVFDQFEEIFTLGTIDKSSELRDNTKNLIDFLADLIENNPPEILPEEQRIELQYKYASSIIPVKVLFSFREEYLSHFYSLSNIIPSIAYGNLQYRLCPLTYEQGFRIIENASYGIFNDQAIDETLCIITEAKDVEEAKVRDIDSFLLSIFCESQINRSLTKGDPVIGFKEVQDVNVQDLVNSIYLSTIKSLDLNDDEKELLEEKLITPEGYRLPVYLNMVFSNPNVRPEKIENLERKKILKRYFVDGKPCVEIIHDKYANSIRIQRDNRKAIEVERLKFEEEQKELERRILEEQKEYERKVEYERTLAEERERLAIIKLEEQEKANKAINEKFDFKRKIQKVLIGLLVFSLLTTAYAFSLRTKAEKSSLIARQQREIAEQEKKKAEIQRKLAEERSYEAQKQKDIAEKEKQRAVEQTKLAVKKNKEAQRQEDIANAERRKSIVSMVLAKLEANRANRIAIMNKELNKMLKTDIIQKDSLYSLAEKQLAEIKEANKKILEANKVGQTFAKIKSLEKSDPALAYRLAEYQVKLDTSNYLIRALLDMMQNKKNYYEGLVEEGEFLEFSSDGSRMLLISPKEELQAVSLNGEVLWEIDTGGEITSAQFSPDGNKVVAIKDKKALLYDVSNKGAKELKGSETAHMVTFSSTGENIISRSNSRVKVYSKTGVFLHAIPVKQSDNIPYDKRSFLSVAGSSDRLLINSIDGISIYDADIKLISVLKDQAFINPNASGFVSFRNGVVALRDNSGNVISNVDVKKLCKGFDKVRSVVSSNDASKVLLILENLSSRLQLQEKGKHIFHPLRNSRTLIVNFNTKQASIFQEYDLSNSVFTPDGASILSPMGDKITVFNQSGDKISEFGRGAKYNFIEFSPQGEFVLTNAKSEKEGYVSKLWIYGTPEDLDKQGKLATFSYSQLMKYSGLQ
ncbi:hypothetical protein [Rufibacter aurantiacus]|uniref:nSTAND1 domain-containing NTPase n=1 Tax=Rufibacter aurantiacus TaxID=2817374 RepID=UPI001B313D08|nr:hypothetical protein [Rufibacter aurantiacus]